MCSLPYPSRIVCFDAGISLNVQSATLVRQQRLWHLNSTTNTGSRFLGTSDIIYVAISLLCRLSSRSISAKESAAAVDTCGYGSPEDTPGGGIDQQRRCRTDEEDHDNAAQDDSWHATHGTRTDAMGRTDERTVGKAQTLSCRLQQDAEDLLSSTVITTLNGAHGGGHTIRGQSWEDAATTLLRRERSQEGGGALTTTTRSFKIERRVPTTGAETIPTGEIT